MWKLWSIASQSGQRPSSLIGVSDQWAALQFDRAVIWMGTFIESKLMETQNVGTKNAPKYESKYKLEDLLADAPQGKPTKEQFIKAFSNFGTVVER
jgi:hypothetical protein